MKYALSLIMLWGCTQKYADYDLIRKVDFNKESYERPVTNVEVMAQGRDSLNECFNQWLFFSNAEKQMKEEIPFLVRALCPHQDFLVNAEFKERWWTTIVFTQACVSIETLCGHLRNKK